MEENHNKIMYRVLQSFLDFSASILLNKIKYISKVELYIWYADLLGKNYDKMEIGKLKGERAKDNIMKNQSDILSSSPSCTVTSDVNKFSSNECTCE